MVVFSVVLLLLIGQFCQGIIIYIKFIVTKILIPIIPILAPSFCLFFLAAIFDLCTQDCWEVVLFSLLSRSNDLKIPLDCLTQDRDVCYFAIVAAAMFTLFPFLY